MRERLGIAEGDPLWAHVEMQNSIERNYSLMRNNTIAQALDALATNVNLKIANVKMYEWARDLPARRPQRAGDSLGARERPRPRRRSGATRAAPRTRSTSRASSNSSASSCASISRSARATDIASSASSIPAAARASGSTRQLVGIVGELHPTLVQRFDIKRQRPVYLELDTDALLAPPLPRVYTEPPSRQPIVRNVAYAIPRRHHRRRRARRAARPPRRRSCARSASSTCSRCRTTARARDHVRDRVPVRGGADRRNDQRRDGGDDGGGGGDVRGSRDAAGVTPRERDVRCSRRSAPLRTADSGC